MRSYIKVQVRYDRPQPVDRRMQSARQTMVNTLSVSAQQGPARAEKEMKRGSTCTLLHWKKKAMWSITLFRQLRPFFCLFLGYRPISRPRVGTDNNSWQDKWLSSGQEKVYM